MYKLNNEIRMNRRNISVCLGVSIIFILIRFSNFLGSEMGLKKNIYDFIFYLIGDFYFITFFISMMFLFMISYISRKRSFDKYCLLKYKNKFNWYKYNLKVLAVYSIGYVVLIIFICLLVGISTLSFTSESIYIEYIKNITKIDIQSNILLVVINLTFIIAYFYILGLLYFISNLRFKNSFWGFLISYGLVVGILNVTIHFLRNPLFYKISMVNNIMLAAHNSAVSRHSPSIGFSFIYFVVLICILIFIGRVIIKKFEITLGDN